MASKAAGQTETVGAGKAGTWPGKGAGSAWVGPTSFALREAEKGVHR